LRGRGGGGGPRPVRAGKGAGNPPQTTPPPRKRARRAEAPGRGGKTGGFFARVLEGGGRVPRGGGEPFPPEGGVWVFSPVPGKA